MEAIMVKVEDMITKLLNIKGVIKLHIKIDIKVKTRLNEELGDEENSFRTVRKREVSQDRLDKLTDDTDWKYVGVIDAMSDYVITDKITKRYTIENEESN